MSRHAHGGAAPVPPRFDRFLRGPRPAVIATLRRDGSPASAATWYLWQGDRFRISMYAGGRRAEHLRRDPRATLTVLGDDWHDSVSVHGRAVEIRSDDDLADIDALSRHYRGEPYPRSPGLVLVSAVIRVEGWHAFAEADGGDQAT